jgi:iron complex outermembrane receptor protein
MKKFHLVAVGLAMVAPAVALAQSIGALEEIVVTAQRREQNLQEVPISVTAMSGEMLEKSNVRGATEYLAQTPNVSFTEDGQGGARSIGIAIRGINNLVSGENAFVNSVGIYLDEFSIASVPNGVANPTLPDMERVEVLRGPQGTYFGRNSLGGALNLSTRNPTAETGGQISLGGEKFDHAGEMYALTGVLNAPLSDAFKVRLLASYEDSSGMVENIHPGGSDSDHEYLTLRAKALWDIADSTRATLTVIYDDQTQGTDENVNSGTLDLDSVDTFAFQNFAGGTSAVGFDAGTNSSSLLGFFPSNQNKVSRDLKESNDLTTTIAIVNVAHQFSDSLTWKTVAGIVDSTQKRVFDNDGIGNLDLLRRDNKYDGTSWSVETRLESRSDTMDWVVGALYAKDDQDQFNNVAVSSDATATLVLDGVEYGFLPPFPQGLGLARNTKNFEVESIAAFADVTWHLNPQADLFVGARYTSDDVINSRIAYGIAPTCGPPNTPGCSVFEFFQGFVNVVRPEAAASRSFNDVSPRAGVRYAVTDATNVYLTVSKGYKAGGTSTGNNTNAEGAPAFNVPYDEETLMSYELGVKTELADRRVRLNASLFWLQWKDLQMEAFRFLTPGDLSSNFEQTVNIPEAEAKGIEVELLARATDNLTLGVNLGYLDTEMTKAPSDGIEITGGFNVDVEGLEIPKSPKVTASAFGEYRWPVAGNEAWVRAEYLHRDGQYSDIEALTWKQTTGPSPNQGLSRFVPSNGFPYKTPAYDVFNLRGGFEWEKTSLTLYVQNLFEEEYYTGTQENFGLAGIRLRPHPRIFGGSVTFRF